MALLHEFGVGEVFGALAGAGAPPLGADVVAADPTRTACVPAGSSSCWSSGTGRWGWRWWSLMQQLRTTSGRMVDRTTLSAPGRVQGNCCGWPGRATGGRAAKRVWIRPSLAFMRRERPARPTSAAGRARAEGAAGGLRRRRLLRRQHRATRTHASAGGRGCGTGRHYCGLQDRPADPLARGLRAYRRPAG